MPVPCVWMHGNDGACGKAIVPSTLGTCVRTLDTCQRFLSLRENFRKARAFFASVDGHERGVAMFCEHCGSKFEDGGKFCTSCGAPRPVAQPPADIPPVYVPQDFVVQDPPQSAEMARKKPVWLFVTLAVLALALCAFVGWRMWSDSHAESQAVAEFSKETVEVDEKTDGGDSSDKALSATEKDKDTKKEEPQPCTAVPELITKQVRRDGSNLVATVQWNASSCENAPLKSDGVQIVLTDSSNDTIAAGIFDFSKRDVSYKDGKLTTELAFKPTQYWRAVTELEPSRLDTSVKFDQEGFGRAADVNGAFGARDIDPSDAERYAHLALNWQLDHDKSTASDFYSIYTTQLSSKRYDMDVEGKIWKYADIYEHFLSLKSKHPQALIVWGSDYPTYTKHGHDASYYVILSGESFASETDATNWCGANGYTANDCLAVDLK